MSFPFGKAIFEQALAQTPGLSTWFIASFTLAGRFLLSALLLFALQPTRVTRSELSQGVGLGLFTGIGMQLQMDGLNFTEASTSAFLTQGYIVILPLVALAVERRLPPARVAVSVVTILLGLAILSGFDPKTFRIGRGETETLIASAFFAAQILWLGRARYRANRSGPVTVVMFAAIAVLLFPISALSAQSTGDYGAVLGSGAALLAFLTLVLLCTLAAFWLMNRFQPFLAPSEAGIIYGAEPVFASLFALVLPGLLSAAFAIDYPNERFTLRLLVGGGLVTLANVLLQLGSTKAVVPQSSKA